MKVTVGVPGLASVEFDPSALLRRLGDLSKPVVIVKRDAQGLAFDTGLTDHEGAPLLVWSLHCEVHQLWYLDRQSNNSVSIRSAKTGYVLTGSREMRNGDRVGMSLWSDKAWQRWYFVPLEEPRCFAIVSAVTAFGQKSIDVYQGASHLAEAQIWDFWDGPAQKFLLLRPQGG